MKPSKRAFITDPLYFLKTPPAHLCHKKSASEQPIRSEKQGLNLHSRSLSANHYMAALPKQDDEIFGASWDQSQSQTTEGCIPLPKVCGGKHLALTASSVLFLLAASIGLVSNLFLVVSQELRFPSYGFRVYDSASQTIHQRTLFDSFHGDNIVPSVNATIGRPKLVIHIGPHKTATTTTQTELTFFQDRLALDNYVYLGRLYHPYSNGERMVLNRTPDSTLQTYFRDMFQKCWKNTKAECVEDLRDLLRSKFKRLDRPMPNILISDEALLKLFDDQSDSELNQNYILMKDILGQDFDIVVVVTYRRFYEWLPSAKHQKDKPTGESSKTQWPGRTRAGTSPQPLFPEQIPMSDIIDEWSREHFFTGSTYATLRALAAPNFSVKVVHMYSKLSIRSNFLCNALPNAPRSCRSSRREDAVHDETRINARIGKEEEEIIRYPSVYFDALATSAVSYIDTDQWGRQKVGKMLRDHYYSTSRDFFDKIHQQAAMAEGQPGSPNINTNNPWQLPIVCPSKERLDKLLHYSLSLEARILPKLFRKSAAEHLEGFRYDVENTLGFCWVDTDKALGEESPWKQHIFTRFMASSTTEQPIQITS